MVFFNQWAEEKLIQLRICSWLWGICRCNSCTFSFGRIDSFRVFCNAILGIHLFICGTLYNSCSMPFVFFFYLFSFFEINEIMTKITLALWSGFFESSHLWVIIHSPNIRLHTCFQPPCIVRIPCGLHKITWRADAIHTHKLLFIFIHFVFVTVIFMLPEKERYTRRYRDWES